MMHEHQRSEGAGAVGPMVNAGLRRALDGCFAHGLQHDVSDEGVHLQASRGPPQQKRTLVKVRHGLCLLQVVPWDGKRKEGQCLDRSTFILGQVGQNSVRHEGLDALAFFGQGHPRAMQVEGEGMTAKASKDGLGVVDVTEDVLCCLIVQRVQHLAVHGIRRFEGSAAHDEPRWPPV